MHISRALIYWHFVFKVLIEMAGEVFLMLSYVVHKHQPSTKKEGCFSKELSKELTFVTWLLLSSELIAHLLNS